jgi:DNA topoisomerase VI subunit B
LERIVFRTSRLLDFVGQRELTAQIGHAVPEWPLVVLKELVDNAIDGCEEAGVAPVIAIEVSTVTAGAAITISDNGPGIAADTVAGILDYSVRVSSRQAYVSPTRGAQGNALKTVVAMPYALHGDRGAVEIVSRGVAHEIVFVVDRIRQEPRISHTPTAASVKNGTSIMVSWPDSACSILASAKARFLQIADGYAWFNPHSTCNAEQTWKFFDKAWSDGLAAPRRLRTGRARR